jgi:hypothetical protein
MIGHQNQQTNTDYYTLYIYRCTALWQGVNILSNNNLQNLKINSAEESLPCSP